jgi:hypothetical protein
MLDSRSRHTITQRIGTAVDELVRDLYSETLDGISVIQEPEITSRLCQRLEERLDNSQAGFYTFRVIAQSLPDRGPRSMEKLFGADLFMSVSLEGPDGFDKGIFIQAKYDRNIDRADLKDACRRMQNVAGKTSVYCWIYEPQGVKVISPHQVNQMTEDSLVGVVPRSIAGFVGRILDCYAGSKEWGIPTVGNRRQLVASKLRAARAKNILDISLKEARPR